MGLHVYTQEVAAAFAGFPIEGRVQSRTEGADENGAHSVVQVAIGTDQARDDGAMGSWVTIAGDASRLAEVFRALAEEIEPAKQDTAKDVNPA